MGQRLVFKVSFSTTGFIKYIITYSYTKMNMQKPTIKSFFILHHPFLQVDLHMSQSQIEKFFQDRNLLLWHFHSTAPRKCILWVPAHSTDYTSTSPLSPEAKIGVFYQISGKQKKTTTYFSDFNIHCLIQPMSNHG